MRKLAMVMALASTALATPAVARDKSWYVGVEGGVMLVEDTQLNLTIDDGVNPPSEKKDVFNIDHNTGFDVDAVVGYDFGRFRLEGELGYKRASIKDFDVSSTFYPNPYYYYYTDGFNASGNVRVLSGMANFLLDFGDEDNWSAFAGLGGGIASVRYKGNIDFNAASSEYYFVDYYDTSFNDTSTKFAWQVVAGVRKAISPNMDLGLKYRFFNVQHLNFEGDNGEILEGRFRSHSLLASLIYNFAPPPPPPVVPVPEPVPVPPPATQTCPDGSVILATETCPAPVVKNVGPFIVFFDWDKSDITPEAAAILDNAAAAYATSGSAQVMLAGHADRSGSADYNVGLSQRRADAVRAYLAGRSVPDSAMTTSAFGESRPLVATEDGVREPQNRRVEITFGPGSGN